jgi:DNA mismatch repair protein MutS
MPPELIQRAHELLSSLEKQRDDQGIQAQSMAEQMPASTPKIQLNIFDAHTATFEDIRNTLNQVDINRLTPVEALLKLEEIKNKLG